MSNPITDFQTRRMGFIVLCEKKGWSYQRFYSNKKNMNQGLGECIDDMGYPMMVLVTAEGRFAKLLGDKKYEEIK